MRRVWTSTINTNAPHLAVNWERGPVNLDGSLRYDIAAAAGRYAGSSGTTAYDVNGEGIIETPEQSVRIVNNGASQPVDYTVRYLSYSAGGNILLNANLALFARVSEGGRANAERMLFGGGIRSDGSIADQVAVDTVKQIEAGLYVADGLEFEGLYERSGFRLRGGLTNAFVKLLLGKGLTLSVAGNNLFNRIGITEIDGGGSGAAAAGVNTARSIDGRTVVASLVYAFQ